MQTRKRRWNGGNLCYYFISWAAEVQWNETGSRVELHSTIHVPCSQQRDILLLPTAKLF